MENELVVLIGVPGSGKSTYASQLVKQGKHVKISRDDIRYTMKGSYMVDEEMENVVSAIQDAMIRTCLDKKQSIVLDNTHCKVKYIRDVIAKYAKRARIVLKVIGAELSIKQIKEQNKQRDKVVPEAVIDNMYKGFTNVVQNKKELLDYITTMSSEYTPEVVTFKQDRTLPKAIIVDIDGTVAKMEDKRGPFDWHKVDGDAPVPEILNIVRCLSHFYKIVFMSGREEVCRQLTEDWLGVYYQQEPVELYMRKAGDYRRDTIVKEELFMEHISKKYFVEACFDDRDVVVQMWREKLGLKCLQVDYGNF